MANYQATYKIKYQRHFQHDRQITFPVFFGISFTKFLNLVRLDKPDQPQ
jgi:hypothetical protein